MTTSGSLDAAFRPLWARARAAHTPQPDLTSVLEIIGVHLLHLRRERLILGDQVDLPIGQQPGHVQIGRTDPGTPAVDDGGLGVHHQPGVLPDAYTRLQERAVAVAGERADPRQVVSR